MLIPILILIAILLASPASAAAYSDDGLNAYRMRNDWNGELQYARAWVRAEPSSALARRRLAEVYLQAQDIGNALPALQQAVRLAPNDGRSWLILGNVYGWRKQYPEGARALRRAAQLMPGSPQAWQNLSAMLALAGDEHGAVTALDDGIRAAAAHFSPVDWYNYGNRLAILHQPQSAIPCYQHAVAMDPKNAAAWNNLGTVDTALGRFNDAAVAYRHAAALDDALGRKNLQDLSRRQHHEFLLHNEDMRPDQR